MSEIKTILITGASSGLGYEIALQYSSPNVRLILIGRNNQRLNKISSLCQNKGAITHAVIVNVRDKVKMAEYLEKFYEQYDIDIVIACAGVSAGTLAGPESSSQVKIIFDTNVNGVLNTIMPVVPHMIAKKAGIIVIVSSMAGLVGLSSAPSYSASKASIRIFGEALRGYLRQYNVSTIVVIPGYIKTPMTDVNKFPMPFMISATKAAQKIIKGIADGKAVIAFPIITYIVLKCLSCLPNQLISYINSKIPGKPSFEKDGLEES